MVVVALLFALLYGIRRMSISILMTYIMCLVSLQFFGPRLNPMVTFWKQQSRQYRRDTSLGLTPAPLALAISQTSTPDIRLVQALAAPPGVLTAPCPRLQRGLTAAAQPVEALQPRPSIHSSSWCSQLDAPDLGEGRQLQRSLWRHTSLGARLGRQGQQVRVWGLVFVFGGSMPW